MTVELANYIDDFNTNFPRDTDLLREGDDHIRLLKNVSKNTFPLLEEPLLGTPPQFNDLDRTHVFDEDGMHISVTPFPEFDQDDETTFPVNNSDASFRSGVLDANEKEVRGCGDPVDDDDAVTLGFLQGDYIAPEEVYSKAQFDTIIQRGERLGWELQEIAYPIGSIYMTVLDVNPETLFGGSWEPYATGRTLLGAGSAVDDNFEDRSFTTRRIGGEYYHKLTVDEIPEHSHTYEYFTALQDHQSSGGESWRWYKEADTGSVGKDLPHNNLQPYGTAYVWQRIN